jgi:hypothetical protein
MAPAVGKIPLSLESPDGTDSIFTNLVIPPVPDSDATACSSQEAEVKVDRLRAIYQRLGNYQSQYEWIKPPPKNLPNLDTMPGTEPCLDKELPPLKEEVKETKKNEERAWGDVRTVFEAILKYGHDEDFEPEVDDNFHPTDAPAGSAEKIEILRRRVDRGQPLFHKLDRVDYAGLTGVIKPRD